MALGGGAMAGLLGAMVLGYGLLGRALMVSLLALWFVRRLVKLQSPAPWWAGPWFYWLFWLVALATAYWWLGWVPHHEREPGW